MVRYTVYFDNEMVKAYDIDEPVIFIGRLPENHIPISNMGISRRHVKIELDAQGGYTLTDLNSLNGTLINGKRVKTAQLQHGDKITIGKYTIVYEDMRGSSAAFLETIVAEISPEDLHRMAAAAASSSGIRPRASSDTAAFQNSGRPAPIPAATQRAPAFAPPAAPPAVAPPVNADAQNGDAHGCPELIETSKHIVYKLDKPYLTIGADDEDDIYATGFMLNKAYAAIELRDGGFHISPQKMMAKVRINGKSVKSHRLKHGDRIEIGANTFRFMEKTGSAK